MYKLVITLTYTLLLILFVFKFKLPASVGQKKIKAIEQVLDELGIGKYAQNI